MLMRSSILFLSLAGGAALVCSNISCGSSGAGFGDGGVDSQSSAGSGGTAASGGSSFGGAGGGYAGSGGYATGGTAAGGFATGGTSSGGFASGGTAAGGFASGGTAAGGVASGGTAAGGTATGGTAAGGSTTSTGCMYSGASSGGIATVAGTGVGGYQSTVGLGGYSFAFNDGVPPIGTGMCAATTMADGPCVDQTAVCVSGTTGIASAAAPYNCYGGGFGINVGQTSGSSTVGTYAVPSASTGITYALSGFPTIAGGGMRIQVTVGGMTYCSPITSGSGTVAWTAMTVACYNPGGAALPGAPNALTNVEFTIDDGTAGMPYDICLTALTF